MTNKKQIKKAETMIKKLTSNNGGVYGVRESHLGTTAQFFDDDSNGIWFKASYSPILEDAIEEFLEEYGWFIEPYDSGTLHAYRD